MYYIEVITTQKTLFSTLQLACNNLNKVQSEFHFFLPENRLKDHLSSLERSQFTSDQAYDFIKEYRVNANGNRPHIIMVVEGQLNNPNPGGLNNLFGIHRASEGMAVFTVSSSERYVKDMVRYCGYYLVRYALSFVAPDVKGHNEEERNDCMFHKKINRSEIIASLDSGKLCDDCKVQVRAMASQEEWNAIKSMLEVISNRFPYALIMKGGGVKGLAFAGALAELDAYFKFNFFAGTSAGAITATLLGAGYESKDLIKILKAQDFNTFKDSFFPLTWFNLLFRKGFYRSNTFQTWLGDLIKKKYTHLASDVEMKDLVHRTVVYASQIKRGAVDFDSKGNRPTATVILLHDVQWQFHFSLHLWFWMVLRYMMVV